MEGLANWRLLGVVEEGKCSTTHRPWRLSSRAEVARTASGVPGREPSSIATSAAPTPFARPGLADGGAAATAVNRRELAADRWAEPPGPSCGRLAAEGEAAGVCGPVVRPCKVLGLDGSKNSALRLGQRATHGPP